MHPDSNILENFTESMIENRDLLVEFCAANELKVTNTTFRKPLDKTATYRILQETIGITNETTSADIHEQIDSRLSSNRWTNTVQNMESDTKANIHRSLPSNRHLRN